jgi:hypothetical protein
MEVLQGKETYVGDVQLGHSRGILASLVNEFESGSLLLRVCQVKCVSFFIVSILTSYFKGGIGQSELPLLLWEISRRSGF